MSDRLKYERFLWLALSLAVRLASSIPDTEIKEKLRSLLEKISFKNDGSLILRFPAADYREVKRKVLGYGSTVKVISPEELAQEIKAEINKMKKYIKFSPTTLFDVVGMVK